MKGNRFSQIRWGEAAVFLIILVVGIVIFLLQLWTWAIPQLTLYQEFIPSRGTILDKRIAEYSSGPNILYRPEVYLEHYVNGQTYRVWTFGYPVLQPGEGFKPDKERAEAALQPFETGKRVNCWYRVNHPQQVIAVWSVSFWGGFLLLLSLSLTALGAVGFSQSFRLSVFSKERQAFVFLPKKPPTGWVTIPDRQSMDESPGTHLVYRLPTSSRPVFPLAGQFVFTAAWTLITLIILIQSAASLRDSHAEQSVDQAVNLVFCFLFCGAGIMLFWTAFRNLWKALYTAPTLLELSDHPVYPGRKYRVLLHQNGLLPFEHLTLDVVCEEIARFHQGTDTATNRQEVFRQTLFSRQNFTVTPDNPLHEEFFLQLPISSMHSFRRQNNEITWKLAFTAALTNRSSPIRRDYPIIVVPAQFNDTALEGSGL
ncbi:MAG: hypothetical protein LBH00_11890 [Planctomycetaceae bacterium]|jgi:hypothetical protein|nr:hypothetical protein [Planctomycetaceae bacterium]